MTSHETDRVKLEFLRNHFAMKCKMGSFVEGQIRQIYPPPESDDKEKFSRPTATYHITHGLSVKFQARIIAALRTTTFSINIDECTSETGKVFSITALRSFFLGNQ